jgi:arylsulfatase A-like enzyme
MARPNIVFVFGDQWRLQSLGYAGNSQVLTPNIDRLSRESVNFTHAVSGCSVCSPYRASLLTGQYPHTHGVFVNDVCLRPNGATMAELFAAQGYDTAYVGKWHLDGHGRSNYIPKDRRNGFEYWKVLECTHDYNNSAYYAGDSDEKRFWDGYDAIAQTEDVVRYIRQHDASRPYLMMLSWGPPHAPYHTAPERYRSMYSPNDIELPPNVPEQDAQQAREWIAGYYAHCTALDDCIGALLDAVEESGQADETIFVFTSDHGDMLGSHGMTKKQKPYEESIRIPFLLRYPARYGRTERRVNALLDAPDVLPTLLGACGLVVPDHIQGLDFTGAMDGGPDPSGGAALLSCYQPFGQWTRDRGGREYRGLRTLRYTYARSLEGPWLLYDNERDPYQLTNCIDDPAYRETRRALDEQLTRKMESVGDALLTGDEYLEKWGYEVDETGTVPYTW